MHHHIMSFHWDTDVGVFLFPGLKITGTTALLGLCVVLLVISLIYEAAKVLQTSSKARTARERMRSVSSSATETTNLLVSDRRSSPGNRTDSKRFFQTLGQALIFLFQNVVGYMLMLAVMVYNVYVFVAVVLGLGLGYFLFGHISMRINMENIRARTTNAFCAERNPLEGGASTSTGSGENEVEFRGNPQCSSSSVNQSANYEPITSVVQAEIDVHPCVGAHDSDNLHTCRL